jgi:hypothetical protein
MDTTVEHEYCSQDGIFKEEIPRKDEQQKEKHDEELCCKEQQRIKFHHY